MGDLLPLSRGTLNFQTISTQDAFKCTEISKEGRRISSSLLPLWRRAGVATTRGGGSPSLQAQSDEGWGHPLLARGAEPLSNRLFHSGSFPMLKDLIPPLPAIPPLFVVFKKKNFLKKVVVMYFHVNLWLEVSISTFCPQDFPVDKIVGSAAVSEATIHIVTC